MKETPLPDEKDTRSSFWTTLPGILTGVAAVLTALTGLWAGLHHAAPADAPPKEAAIIESASTPAKSTAPANPEAAASQASLPTTQPTSHGTVTVVSRKGVTTQLQLKNFQHNMTEFSLELTSGQSIPFDKIRTIDFNSIDTIQDYIAVTITLVDGRALSDSIKEHYAFQGENDLGPFTIFTQDVKQITFNR